MAPAFSTATAPATIAPAAFPAGARAAGDAGKPTKTRAIQLTLNLTEPLRFDGSTYHAPADRDRLASQVRRVFARMQDANWRTLAEIAYLTGDPQASVSARLRDLRKDRFGRHAVNRRRRGPVSDGLFEYQLIPNQEQP